jgi:hypothetical protein
MKNNVIDVTSFAIENMFSIAHVNNNNNILRNDIMSMISICKERFNVCFLALYYMHYIKKKLQENHLDVNYFPKENIRLLYIVCFGIAIKYLEDTRCVQIAIWSKFALVSQNIYINAEREILQYLEYNLDPGGRVIEDIKYSTCINHARAQNIKLNPFTSCIQFCCKVCN